ncbi:MAG: glycosyltransferase family 1 protein [Thermoguttaceae bacterium]|nr:glycosyltransferase family 1 protein [Thermoguttaceae bacterium]
MTMRVLHVVGRMNAGGVETWLLRVLRRADRGQLEMDFLVHDERPGLYDDEIRRLGSAVLRCPYPRRPWRFARSFRRALREHGPYDVIHSHVHHYSGYVLKLARSEGVARRIAHSHNDRAAAESGVSLGRRAYLAISRHWLRRHATARLACSRSAGVSLFGRPWLTDSRARVVHYGVDLAEFAAPADGAAVRKELGLAPDDFVLGHVGRYCPQKNHRFLLDIAAEAARREPRIRLLLLGEGPLRAEIDAQARVLGLGDRVTALGVRRDVPRVLAAVDVFVFPSLWEGLPLAVLEAQAAGLPCVVSDRVTAEADAIRSLVYRRSLDQDAAAWVDAIREARPARMPRQQAVAALAGSTFDLERTPRVLWEIYGAACC